MPSVLAVVDDLFFAAKIQETARQVGCEAGVRPASAAITEAAQAAPSLIIVDLNCRSADPVNVIRTMKGNEATRQITIVAFGSHVEKAGLDQARAAGADHVMARSDFVSELPALLGKYGSPSIASES